MLELILRFLHGKYPYLKGKNGPNTYMQYLIQAKDEQQELQIREISQIFKKIQCPHISKLLKMMKEDHKFHLLYQYSQQALEQRLKQLQNEEQLSNIFIQLESVFQTLIQQKLKATLYLEFMGINQYNKLKVWLKPDEIQCLSNSKILDNKLKSQLTQFYETQRTRIHLQIQQIFQKNELINMKYSVKNIEKQSNLPKQNKTKCPNFVIEGNNLVFLSQPVTNVNKLNKSYDNNKKNGQKAQLNEKNQTSKHRNEQKSQSTHENKSNKQVQQVYGQKSIDMSKMSIAQKVLYYKKQKQNSSQNSGHQNNLNKLLIKQSSTGNASQNDISKSSDNDSNLNIKTEFISKTKMKITTSQQIQVEGNSDDDLQKIARSKMAQLHQERHDRSHNHGNGDKQQSNVNSKNQQENVHNKDQQANIHNKEEKYLKELSDHSREQKNIIKYPTTDINQKVMQAKQKARSILQKYSQKLKK